MSIHASHPHVVLIVNVGKPMGKRFALASHPFWARHQHAALSVLLVLNALLIKHAWIKSAWIHALDVVVKTLSAEFKIIVLFALVYLVILEMHFLYVYKFHVSFCFKHILHPDNVISLITYSDPPQDIPEHVNPCYPPPCGPNSHCISHNNLPSCTCLSNYYGSPPNCHPECTINQDCQSNKACIRSRCSDPCPGSCGFYAQCNVINHTPVCSCNSGYTGDPFSGCRPIPPSCKFEVNF